MRLQNESDPVRCCSNSVLALCVCASFFQFSQRGLSDDNHTRSFSLHESLVLDFFRYHTLCAVLICGVSSNKYSNSPEINYALHIHIFEGFARDILAGARIYELFFNCGGVREKDCQCGKKTIRVHNKQNTGE